MDRRSFLAAAATLGTPLAAGCAGGESGEPTPEPTEPPTERATPEPTGTATATAAGSAARREYPDYEWGLLEGASPVATTTVTMENFAFDPLVAEVPVGTPIRFANEDGSRHTVTIPALDVDRSVSGGGETTIEVAEPGTYGYVCALHPPEMLGRLVASEDVEVPTETGTPTPTPTATATPEPAVEGADAVVEAVGTAFAPLRAEVEVGATVGWVNRDGVPHTVTSAEFHDVAASWEKDARFGPSETTTHTFEEAGVYEYYCTIHGRSVMCGAVLVGGATLEESLPCESGSSGY